MIEFHILINLVERSITIYFIFKNNSYNSMQANYFIHIAL